MLDSQLKDFIPSGQSQDSLIGKRIPFNIALQYPLRNIFLTIPTSFPFSRTHNYSGNDNDLIRKKSGKSDQRSYSNYASAVPRIWTEPGQTISNFVRQ